MRLYISLLLLACLSGCSFTKEKADVLEVVKEVELVPPKKVDCGSKPLPNRLTLKDYAPTYIPPLPDLGIDHDRVPDWLLDHLDHGWWALSVSDWQSVDENDIDKKALTEQWRSVAMHYKNCIDQHNESIAE